MRALPGALNDRICAETVPAAVIGTGRPLTVTLDGCNRQVRYYRLLWTIKRAWEPP